MCSEEGLCGILIEFHCLCIRSVSWQLMRPLCALLGAEIQKGLHRCQRLLRHDALYRGHQAPGACCSTQHLGCHLQHTNRVDTFCAHRCADDTWSWVVLRTYKSQQRAKTVIRLQCSCLSSGISSQPSMEIAVSEHGSSLLTSLLMLER